MIQLISYPVRAKDPAWPGNPTIRLEPHTSIDAGDVANTYMIHIFNHYGTHFDAPKHFYGQGLPIASLPLERFFYESPLLLDIPKGAGEKVTGQDLLPYAGEIARCDLLMLRTGFSRMRVEDPNAYSYHGPALGSSGAKYLMDTFTNIKAVALDFISLASYGDQEDGNLAHQYMLGAFHSHYICIIEDVDLSRLPGQDELADTPVKRAAALPLFIEGVDSSPVTMWAEW
ncbi:MAG: cyclase family protein [Lachnospiraceae bacterium]|nr:cyclase family protein [Lachnospiraceae bacterium]